jgi:peroxiredoxin
MKALTVLAGLLVVVGQAERVTAMVQEGEELIGTAAPGWDAVEWVNSTPLTLEQLRGNVVLVRWWTGPECPYCATSAPHLNAWHQTYRQHGLVVIGFYHHKSPTPLSRKHVTRLIKRYRFSFPIAVDPEWRTLTRWWLDGHHQRWTSVSFLIDRAGVIRHIHPGGSYSEAEARAMEAMIQQLLESPPRDGAS